MKQRRLFKRIFLGTTAIVLLAGVLIFTLDLGFLKGFAEQRLSALTGRAFNINGALSIRLGSELTITAEDISLADAPWTGSQKPFVSATRVHMVIDPLSAWSGPLLIMRLEINEPEVALFQSETGLGNWALAPKGKVPAEDVALPFLLDSMQLTGADVEFHSPRLDRSLVARVESLTQGRDGEQFKFELGGQLNGSPVNIAGHVGPYSKLLSGEDITVTGSGNFGRMTLTGDARFDQLWSPLRPEIDVQLSGPDFSELTGMLGIEGLGSGDMDLHIGSKKSAPGLALNITGHLGEFQLDINSVSASLPELINGEFTVHASGPNFGRAARLAGAGGWPEEPFAFDAVLRRPNGGLLLETFDLELARATLHVDGALPSFPDLAGSQLTLRATGSDIAPFRAITGLPDMPPGAFRVSGDIGRAGDGSSKVDLGFEFPVGQGTVSGTIGSGENWLGTRLSITADGMDASQPAALLELPDLGNAPWSLDMNVALEHPEYYEIDDLRFTTAGFDFGMKGRAGVDPQSSSDFRFSVRGESLARMQVLAGDALALPEQPFEIDGHVKSAPGGWTLAGLTAQSGAIRFQLDGHLGSTTGMAGTDLSITAEGIDLGKMIEVPGQARLPDGPFELATRLRMEQQRLLIDDFEMASGPFHARVSTELPWPADLSNGKVSMEITGVNITRVLPELAGMALDAEPYTIQAKSHWKDGTITIDDGSIRVGETRFIARGTLDLPPNLSATDLSIELQSPDLSSLGTFDGERWGTIPVDLKSSFRGTATQFVMDSFTSEMGESRYNGSLEIDFSADVPDFTLALNTNLLDLRPFLGDEEEPTEKPKPEKGARLIPDTPFPTELLNSVNGRFSITAERVQIKKSTLQNVSIAGQVQDGALRVGNMGTDGLNGKLNGSFSLEPADDGTQLRVRLSSRALVLNLTGQTGADKQALPPFDIDIDLNGKGSTLRETMASLNGRFHVHSPGGTIRKLPGTGADSLFLAELVSAISPSAARQEVITISCFATVAAAQEGTFTLDPGIALQADKLNIFARGKINLATEKIDVNFRTQTRKTIDLAAGELMSPYVKLGGTLANPSVSLDPKGTLLSGGAAYLSGGLSILAKKALEQMAGTRNPCEEFLEQIEQEATPP